MTTARPATLALAAALVLPACRGPAPCLDVHGACVLFDGDFPPDARGFVKARIAPAFDRGATYWDADPDSLRGWVIVVHGYWPMSIHGMNVWGRTDDEERRIDLALQRPLCPELVLVHELGHAFGAAENGDTRPHGPDEDPRFEDEAIMRLALDGVQGCEWIEARPRVVATLEAP